MKHMLLFFLLTASAAAQVAEFPTDSTNIRTDTYGDWRQVPTFKRIVDELNGKLPRDSALKNSWDDLRIPLSGAKPPTSNPPTFTATWTNNAGSSTGVGSYYFSETVEQSLYFEIQLPHTVDTAQPLHMHIHWYKVGAAAADTAKEVVWGLEYAFASPSDGEAPIYKYDTTHTIYTPPDPEVGRDDGTVGEHMISEWAPITINTQRRSAILLGRVFRAVSQPLDDYPRAAAGLSIDCHFRSRGFGTRSEYGDTPIPGDTTDYFPPNSQVIDTTKLQGIVDLARAYTDSSGAFALTAAQAARAVADAAKDTASFGNTNAQTALGKAAALALVDNRIDNPDSVTINGTKGSAFTLVASEVDPNWASDTARSVRISHPAIPGLAPAATAEMLTIQPATGAITKQAIPAAGLEAADTSNNVRKTNPIIPGLANADAAKFLATDASGKLVLGTPPGTGATLANVADSIKALANGTGTVNISCAAMDTNQVAIFQANDTSGVSITTIAGDVLYITASMSVSGTGAARVGIKYGTTLLSYVVVTNGATGDRVPISLQAVCYPGAATNTVAVTKGPVTLAGNAVPACFITVMRIRRN